MDEENKQAIGFSILILSILLLFLPLPFILDSVMPKKVLSSISNLLILPLGWFFASIAIRNVGEGRVMGVIGGIIGLLLSLTGIPAALMLGIIPLDLDVDSILLISGAFVLITTIVRFILNLSGPPPKTSSESGGGKTELKKEREKREISTFDLLGKENRATYHRAYSDYRRYFTENPPDHKLPGFFSTEDEVEAYKKGWEDSKSGEPRRVK